MERRCCREGNNLYAQGRGTLTWYQNGKIIQTDEGTFERGKQNGKFKHTSESGKVGYTNWDHGQKIPLDNTPVDNTPTVTSTGKLNAQDLSLGDLSIDDRAGKVQSVLGNPLSVKNENDGGKRLKYKDIEVFVKNGKVFTLISLSPKYKTPRGIHEGSSLQEVIDNYGKDFKKTSHENQILYEYMIQSADGQKCYLRFAINSNGKVAYISERVVH